MKKRIFRLLLGVMYIFLMALLLLIHVQRIAGDIQRVMATVETLFLTAFTVGVLVLYLKTDSGPKGTEESKKEVPPAPESLEDFTMRLARLCEGADPAQALSRRETEVAWLLYRGYTNRQIGEELYIAETTVKKHASHIYEKLGISGKLELREKILKENESSKGMA